MRIQSVAANRHKRVFELAAEGSKFTYPFATCVPQPSPSDPLKTVVVDDELGREAFTYVLTSGHEGTVHIEQVLDYSEDPEYLRSMLVYRLALEAGRTSEKREGAQRVLGNARPVSPPGGGPARSSAAGVDARKPPFEAAFECRGVPGEDCPSTGAPVGRARGARKASAKACSPIGA